METPISPKPQPDVDPRRPEFLRYSLPVTTTNTLPDMSEIIGIVVGVATRLRDQAHNPDMHYINTRARQDALGAMVMQAMQAEADAVIGVRFDSDQISDSVSEITAYGTAVKIASPPPRPRPRAVERNTSSADLLSAD